MAPGAPLALRRALSSGADVGFATTLQVVVALLAVVVLPLWVMIGNAILGTRGIADAGSVARQVTLAQILPLVLGVVARRMAPLRGPQIGIMLGRAGAVLLILAITSIMVDVPYSVLATHPRPIVVAAVTTTAALFIGHLLGGARPEVRHSLAIAGAQRRACPADRDNQSNATRCRGDHRKLRDHSDPHRDSLHPVVDKDHAKSRCPSNSPNRARLAHSTAQDDPGHHSHGLLL
jgi:hypothetical protein